jgi:hypothetical protein
MTFPAKNTILMLLLLVLSVTTTFSQSVGEPVIYVKNLMKKYSPESFFIIDQDDKSPRVFDFENGGKMSFTNRNDLNAYIKATQFPEIINEINTGVHETTHDFTSILAYKNLLDKGIKNIGMNNYLCFAPDKNNMITVRITKIFPSSELGNVVEDDFQTERFATYVFPSRAIMGTQVHGVYGLLDEFHAYYHGTKAIYDLKPFFETEVKQTSANWIVYFKNIYSTYYAYAEFRYFILKYLIYAKQTQPDVYERIMENKEFKDAFLKTDKAYATLISEFNANKTIILKNLKAKGIVVTDKEDGITLDKYFAMSFKETYDFFMEAMKEQEFTDMMAALSASGPTTIKNDANLKTIKIQFDATSMVESFGSVKSVTILGDFNDDVNDSRYMLKPVSAGSSIFEITLKLKPGKHLYKLNVDGMFMNDMSSAGFMLTPAPSQYEDDKEGGKSAVLIVN